MYKPWAFELYYSWANLIWPLGPLTSQFPCNPYGLFKNTSEFFYVR